MAMIRPLSHNQRLIWHMQRLLPPECPLYRDSIVFRILSDYDILAVRQTCHWLAERHAALRTTFGIGRGRPVQVVREAQKTPFVIHDARDLNEGEFRAEFERQATRPFDLETGPLLRANLFLREPGRHVLLLSFHHIATDLYSSILILQDFQMLYPRACREGTPPPPPKPAYNDFVSWQTEFIESAEGIAQWKYWQAVYGQPAAKLSLPFDQEPEARIAFDSAAVTFSLSADLTALLRSLAQSLGSTLNAVLMAGFQVLLHHWCGQERFHIRTIVAGRSEPSFASVVGCFANPVSIHADFTNDPTFAQVTARAREAVVGALDNQDLPFLLIAERLRGSGRASPGLSTGAMFRLQIPHRFRSEMREQKLPDTFGDCVAAEGIRSNLGGLNAELSTLTRKTTFSSIDLELVEAGGEISGAFNYRTGLFHHATIARLAERYAGLLQTVAADPAIRVSRVDIGPGSVFNRSGPMVSDASRRREARPLTLTEQRIAQLWSDLFHVPGIAGDDNFFALGGDSLLAVQLSIMIAFEFGSEIAMEMLLECPTVAELAAHIDRSRA